MQQFSRPNLDTFKYNLPDATANEYAANAVNLLKVIEESGVEYVPYFLAADVVLTLSGVRAFDTYITFEGLDSIIIDMLATLLAKHDLTLGSETTEYEEPVDFYSLINHRALAEIPRQYHIKGWFNPNPPYTAERLQTWAYVIEWHLKHMMTEDTLPKEWLGDPYAIHDIRFGMLLGYPGEAIASECWSNLLQDNQTEEIPDSQDRQTSTVAYHDAYNAAWPTYEYAKTARTNLHIIAHQQLWSDILTNVYESDWHLEIKKNPTFSGAATTIANLKQ